MCNGSPGGWIITNTVPFVNITNYPAEEQITETLAKYPNVVAFDMDETAKEVATVRSSNMVLLGAAARFTGIPTDKIEDGIRTVFRAKGEKIVESNLAAFRAGVARAAGIEQR